MCHSNNIVTTVEFILLDKPDYLILQLMIHFVKRFLAHAPLGSDFLCVAC